MKPKFPREYPVFIARSLSRLDSMALRADAGAADPEFARAMHAGAEEAVFAPVAVRNRTFARLCIAGLWLANDFLDECHAIAQADEGSEGSWWHAILHRREGDFSNSKYWYRRVGTHPEFGKLKDWDPFGFVDRCGAAARTKGEAAAGLIGIQAEEFMVLFDYCYRKASDG